MERYAQTNLQLYNQMLAAQYSDHSLSLVVRAYTLAMKLFSGRFRANGKPFMSHLVGTASVLVAQNAPVEVVVAGLLHAAYAQGVFGCQVLGITLLKRKHIRQSVGDGVESLITLYTQLPWKLESMMAIRDRLPTLSETERIVVLMRLANELEDYIDLGMNFCHKNHQDSVQKEWDTIVAIARGLEYSDLADQLADIFHATATTCIPGVLCRTESISFSYGLFSWSTPFTRLRIKAFLKRLIPVPVLTTLKQILGSI